MLVVDNPADYDMFPVGWSLPMTFADESKTDEVCGVIGVYEGDTLSGATVTVNGYSVEISLLDNRHGTWSNINTTTPVAVANSDTPIAINVVATKGEKVAAVTRTIGGVSFTYQVTVDSTCFGGGIVYTQYAILQSYGSPPLVPGARNITISYTGLAVPNDPNFDKDSVVVGIVQNMAACSQYFNYNHHHPHPIQFPNCHLYYLEPYLKWSTTYPLLDSPDPHTVFPAGIYREDLGPNGVNISAADSPSMPVSLLTGTCDREADPPVPLPYQWLGSGPYDGDSPFTGIRGDFNCYFCMANDPNHAIDQTILKFYVIQPLNAWYIDYGGTVDFSPVYPDTVYDTYTGGTFDTTGISQQPVPKTTPPIANQVVGNHFVAID